MKKSFESTRENNAGVAVLACGIACSSFGVLVILSETSNSIKNFLQFNDSVGPLSGKVGIAILLWVLSWVFLKKWFAKRDAAGKTLFKIGLGLLFLAFLFTFPPFFNLFK